MLLNKVKCVIFDLVKESPVSGSVGYRTLVARNMTRDPFCPLQTKVNRPNSEESLKRNYKWLKSIISRSFINRKFSWWQICVVLETLTVYGFLRLIPITIYLIIVELLSVSCSQCFHW